MKISNLFSSMIFLSSVFSCGIFSTAFGWVVPLISFFLMITLIPNVKYKGLLHWYPWMFLVLILGFFSPYDQSIHRAVILATPILVGMVASSLKWKEADIDWIIKLVTISAIIFICIAIRDGLIFGMSGFAGIPVQMAVTLIWLFVIRYKIFGNIKNLSLAVILETIIILAISRMSVFAGLLSLSSLRKGKLFSSKNIFLVIFIVMLFIGFINIPSVWNKFVYKGTSFAEISHHLNAINSNGRLEVWSLMVDEIRKKPFFGHGANASEPFTLAINKAFDHPHDEFLRILFDYGLFGMVLFSYGFYRQIRRLHYLSGLLDENRKKFIVQSALWLFVPYLTLMTTDNVLLYAAFMLNIHFLFIGIAESFVPDLYKVKDVISIQAEKTPN